MGAYGLPRNSRDIDIVTKLPRQERPSELTIHLRDEGFVEYKVQYTEDGLVRRYKKDDWLVDVFEAVPEVFNALKRNASIFTLKNKTIYVISIRDLIQMKKRRASSQDLVDIASLEWLKRQEINRK